ncbi:MAG TPA: hypothetical protein VMD08_09630 [Candidatus Baltobacteraceae bacterium]|nr:hypothetical protein [Candidatus Baltobacteraceae bacterium]
MAIHSALNWLSIVAAFVSGALWLYASLVRVPTKIGSGYGALVGVEEMTTGFKKQAFWNSCAAAATAAAALLQAAAMVIPLP